MKLTTDTIVASANALLTAKLTKMESKDKFKVIRAQRIFVPVAEAFEKFKADAREKLKPEDFEQMQAAAKRYDSLTAEERAQLTESVAAYEKTVNECIADELRREQELDYETISAEAFGALLDSNDFTVAVTMALQDALCGNADIKE